MKVDMYEVLPRILGAMSVLIAIAMVAIMGYFPRGFVEPTMTPENFLASTPHMHVMVIFIAAYMIAATMTIGGLWMVCREKIDMRFIARS